MAAKNLGMAAKTKGTCYLSINELTATANCLFPFMGSDQEQIWGLMSMHFSACIFFFKMELDIRTKMKLDTGL